MVVALMNTLLRGSSLAVYILGMFLSNLVLGLIVLEFLRRFGRRQRLMAEVPAR
jgi:hypothetical protein